MFDIDYVFPWVNDADSVWRNTYKEYCKKHGETQRLNKMRNERYRDWGLLKYLLRAIAVNMPWIRKLHLIVSNLEQVPAWINQEEVHIVLHEDIMPPEVLPTFNSTTIEMFIANIPDLAEHFIYGNDDIYPLRPTLPDDWFTEDELPRFNMRHIAKTKIMNKQFRVVCAQQWWKLLKLTNSQENLDYYCRPWHGLAPLVKSKCNEVLDLLGRDEVLKSTSAFRKDSNFNQYIYTDYMYMTGYYEDSNVAFSYISAKVPRKMLGDLQTTKSQVICLNDCSLSATTLQLAQTQILCAQLFERRFPNKCKYEN